MLTGLSTASRVWAVFSVKPRCEEVVVEALARGGLEGYCPRLGGRRAGGRVRPLFPGYCFVFLSPRLELAAARRTPWLLRPLLFHEQLACVEPELVDLWREREGGRGYLIPAMPPPFAKGQRVRFSEGVFAGLEGTVLEVLPSRERVRLLLEHLGGTLQVETDRDLLR